MIKLLPPNDFPLNNIGVKKLINPSVIIIPINPKRKILLGFNKSYSFIFPIIEFRRFFIIFITQLLIYKLDDKVFQGESLIPKKFFSANHFLIIIYQMAGNDGLLSL